MQTTRAYGLNNINYEKWNDVENIWDLKSWQQTVKVSWVSKMKLWKKFFKYIFMFLPRWRLNENNKSLKILPHYNDYKL